MCRPQGRSVRRASHHLATNPVLEGFLLTWISIGLLSQASKAKLMYRMPLRMAPPPAIGCCKRPYNLAAEY